MNSNSVGIVSMTLAISLSGSALAANCDLEMAKKVLPGTNIDKVEHFAPLNLCAVYVEKGQGAVYLSPNGEYIIGGKIFTKDGKAITDIALGKIQQEASANELKSLVPSELIKDAKKVIHGNSGKGHNQYAFIVFTDPECPYCTRLEHYLKDKDIEVYYNFLPLAFHRSAEQWSLEILSAKDTKKAMSDIFNNQKSIGVKINDNAKSTLKNMTDLAKKLGISGTPNIYVLDKRQNRIVDIVRGANTTKLDIFINTKGN